MRGRRRQATIFYPPVPGIDWAAVLADPTVPVVVTNHPSWALKMCLAGQPAFAVMGVSEAELARTVEALGAKVQARKNMN